MVIFRILEDVDKLEHVTVEGSHETSKIDNENFHRNIKGDVIDAMEEKIKIVRQLGLTIKFHINLELVRQMMK